MSENVCVCDRLRSRVGERESKKKNLRKTKRPTIHNVFMSYRKQKQRLHVFYKQYLHVSLPVCEDTTANTLVQRPNELLSSKQIAIVFAKSAIALCMEDENIKQKSNAGTRRRRSPCAKTWTPEGRDSIFCAQKTSATWGLHFPAVSSRHAARGMAAPDARDKRRVGMRLREVGHRN